MGILTTVRDIVRKYWEDDYSDDYSAKGICGHIFFSFFSPLTRKSVFILSCIAVSLDPLFFYIPTIDEKDKCLGIDKNLRTAALIVRALPDATFALRTIISGYEIYTYQDVTWLGTLQIISLYSITGFVGVLFAVSLMLPIPQLAIAVFFFKSGGSGHFGQRVTVNVFLIIYYLARVILIHISSQKVKYNTGIWVRASFNLFLYMVAANVLGGFWYFFSIQREISCWQSCGNALGCGVTYCSDSTSRDITFLDELCPINPQNTTIFNFGIFFEAIQSGTTRSLHFPTKFFYVLWWGIRNLSNFGTNLQTSSYVWETYFAVVICITGLLLFLYLIGNVQIYMLHAKTKSLEADGNLKELKHKIQMWMEENGIPEEMVKDIKQEINNDKLVEKNKNDKLDVHYMFSVLFYTGRILLQRHFCMGILENVKVLQTRREGDFATIAHNYLQPKIFKENDTVVEADEPLHSILFIISGSMEAHVPIREPLRETANTKTFKKGMLLGEELLDWAAKTETFDDQPLSNITVRCTTEIEAFALTVQGLKRLIKTGILKKSSKGEV